jgi:hypothetical protein
MTTLFRILAAALLALPLAASAAGTVTHLVGTLSAEKPDGAIRILARDSKVDSGDRLTTEKDSHAQIKFSDGGQITLKPGTSVSFDSYAFDKEQPAKDTFVFSLIKGGLRALTGLIGKRGNQDAFRLKTPTATIGVRGTDVGVDTVPEGGPLPAGVYLVVFDGVVVAFNEAGFRAYEAGQYGFIQNLTTPPQVLQTNPGVSFTLPPGFSSDQPAACAVR